MAYSTPEQRAEFLSRFDHPADAPDAPMWLLDMDGNVLLGYDAAPGAAPLEGEFLNPKRQHIPNGFDAEALIASGQAERRIFANKGLDVRLPADLRDTLNDRLAAGDRFTIGFLTSRGFDEAMHVLRESGVTDLANVTMAADSGNSLQIGGQRRDARLLNAVEKDYLDGLQSVCDDINESVLSAYASRDDMERAPPVTLERKGAAYNVHYRELLAHLGHGFDTSEARRVAAFVEGKVADFLNDGPHDANGLPIFSLMPGRNTFEIKLAKLSKADGVRSVLQAAQEAGRKPAIVTFAGDDVFHWKEDEVTGARYTDKTPGTDWSAMTYVKDDLENEFGAHGPVRGQVVHTHHPLRESLQLPVPVEEAEAAITPNPMMAVPESSPLHASKERGVDLTTATPLDTAELVVEAVRRMERAQQPKGRITSAERHNETVSRQR